MNFNRSRPASNLRLRGYTTTEGEDIVYVSRQMGHANVSITANVYAHLIDNRRPQAAAKTDALLFGKKVVAD